MRVATLLRYAAILSGAGALLFSSVAIRADELQDITKLLSQGQYAPALEKVNTFLAAHPKDAQGRFLKGIVLTEEGKQTEAIQIFSALTEEFPELPEPYNNLAVIYASQGQYEKARNALELAIHTHPSYGTAHENLGDVYAKLATKSYDKALQLDKNNTSAQSKLALIRTLFDTKGPAVVPPVPSSPPPKSEGKSDSARSSEPAGAAKTPPPAKDVDPATTAVSDTVRSWAAAWSAKDPDNYLGFYAADFKTPNGEARAAWEKLRRERLGKPGPIQVQLQDFTVSLEDKDSAQVSFKQKYSSSNLKTVNLKTLVLRRSGDKWVIVEERVRG